MRVNRVVKRASLKKQYAALKKAMEAVPEMVKQAFQEGQYTQKMSSLERANRAKIDAALKGGTK